MWSARSGTMSAAARCRPSLEARGLCDGLCRVGELPTGVVDKRRDAAGVNAYEILPGAWDAMTWSDALARLAARTDVVCFGSLAQRSAASHATVVRFLDGVIRRGAADAARVRRQPAAGFLLAGGAGGVDGSLQYFEDQRRGGSARGRMPDRMSRRRSGRAVPGVARPPGEPRNGHPHRGRRGQPRVHPEPDFGLCDSPRVRVRPVDTVGAGDSFTAAFCAMLAAGYDIWLAQAFASKVAAFVCSCAGATPDTWAAAKTEFSGNL